MSTSLFDFVDDTQACAKVILYNGSHFIGKTDPSAKEEGGQLFNLTSSNTQFVYLSTDNSSLLLAGHFANGDDSVSVLQILTASVSSVEGLVRPTSVAVSPVDGKYVYVAAEHSSLRTGF